VGGNAYSEFDPDTGIEIHKYGSHLFHTSNKSVYDYITRFTQLNQYHHRVKAISDNAYYDIPINLSTISSVFEKALTPKEAENLLMELTNNDQNLNRESLEEKAISNIGVLLYEKFIRGYTIKQWQTHPKLLPAETINRLPVRFDFNNFYFDDIWQGLPLLGYQTWFNAMLKDDKINVITNTDFFEIRDLLKEKKVVFTGPIDRFFNYKFGALGWRTLDFEIETHEVSDYQGIAVLNYVDKEVPWTRIHEFKHLHPERKSKKNRTVIMKEFSRAALEFDDPYYPINSLLDRQKLAKYRELSKSETNVIFGGRLGTYKYLDMHMAIASALTFMKNDFQLWLRNNCVQ
jgi:UDP-galactopyranose mutase